MVVRFLMAIFIIVVVNISNASEPLVVGYWNEATPPFAIRNGDKLEGGIIKDIGDELGGRLKMDVVYKLVPVKRIERELTQGGIHLDCVTSPIWKESPEAYLWSPVLFQGADRFLVRSGEQNAIRSLDDLKGKLVGVYQGYVYHPDVMALFDAGKSTAIQVDGIESGVKLLRAKRIDALIDFGVLLQYQLKKQHLASKLDLAEKHADNFELMCAYSPKLPIEQSLVDQSFRTMVSDKTISKILSKYR